MLFWILAFENVWLNRSMRELFGPDRLKTTFKSEIRFLRCTLVTFSVSYLVMVLRNVVNGLLLTVYKDSARVEENFCDNPFLFNLVNLTSYMLIEILPFMSVAWLNYRNFVKEMQNKEHYNHEIHDTDMSEIKSFLANVENQQPNQTLSDRYSKMIKEQKEVPHFKSEKSSSATGSQVQNGSSYDAEVMAALPLDNFDLGETEVNTSNPTSPMSEAHPSSSGGSSSRGVNRLLKK